MYVHTYICTFIQTCVRTYVRTYIHMYIGTIHTYITYIHYVRIYIRTYIHWVKAHVGTYGNELADQLAKAAAQNGDTSISYNKISKGTLISEIEEKKTKWQKQWNECTKANITKQFFPNVQERLKVKINVTTNFARMVAGHRKTREYFHRFKIMKQVNVLATMEIKH